MFRYVFIIMMMGALFSIAAPDTTGDTGTSMEDVSEGDSGSSSAGVDEEDTGEPSLEGPSETDSTTFEAGEPPVTEESLEEEDASDQPPD